jgi:subtilase family serine protease
VQLLGVELTPKPPVVNGLGGHKTRLGVSRRMLRLTLVGVLWSAVLLNWVAHGLAGSCSLANTSACVTLHQLRTAYQIQPLLARGIDGRGQTITVTARLVSPRLSARWDGPVSDIRSDLAAFDRLHGLPSVKLSIALPAGASPSVMYRADREEVLDVEMTHAIAPAAAIRVSPVAYPWTDSTLPRVNEYLISLVRHALQSSPQTDVISVSEAISDLCPTPVQYFALDRILRLAAARGITVVASSGDTGPSTPECGASYKGRWLYAVPGVGLPAADPLVTAVGGTRLLISPTGRYLGETAWQQNFFGSGTWSDWPGTFASGGGYSVYWAPPYQRGRIGGEDTRGVPDVAADADSNTGIVTAYVLNGQTEYAPASGTSASAPLWAGIVALADQYSHRRLGFINVGLYRIAESSHSTRPFTTSWWATTALASVPLGRPEPGTPRDRAGMR